MFRDGRWFWWVVAACLCVVAADVGSVGPFREPSGRPVVEVLGDAVEREQHTATTTTAVLSVTPTTLSEDEALEQLQGLDQETLDALEDIKGVDPAELTSTTTR